MKKVINVFQMSFMALIAITSLAFSACSNDEDGTDEGGNDGSMVSVKYAATGTVNTYRVILANYVDNSANQIAPSNDVCFMATFSADKNVSRWYDFQFYVEQYKDAENGQIKEFTGFKDFKVGSHLIISRRRLFFFLGGGMSDEELHGASNPHGDVIVKSINGKNLTLELKDFSFTNYNGKAETIINGTMQYIPD